MPVNAAATVTLTTAPAHAEFQKIFRRCEKKERRRCGDHLDLDGRKAPAAASPQKSRELLTLGFARRLRLRCCLRRLLRGLLLTCHRHERVTPERHAGNAPRVSEHAHDGQDVGESQLTTTSCSGT